MLALYIFSLPPLSSLCGPLSIPLSPSAGEQLNEAKKKVDDDQVELEEVQNARRKLDLEAKALQERLEELKAENAKLTRGKKKVQEEVGVAQHPPTRHPLCGLLLHIRTIIQRPVYPLSCFILSFPPPASWMM